MTYEARRAMESRAPRAGAIIIGAIVAILAVTGGAFVLAGANPIDAYFAYFVRPLTREFTLLEVLNSATPLLLPGTAVAIAFRAGYWNIGVEGQLLMGAVAAAGVGQLAEGWPALLVLPAMVGAGALAGAAWALVPALLRVRLGIDEVVTTLLLNPVALLVVDALLRGPWTDPETGFPESPRIATSAEFPQLAEFLPFLGRSRLHLGFVIAVVIIVIGWWVLSRTATGLRVRAVGLSPHGARFAGIKVERTLLRVALVSGAIAGIAGVSEVAGIQFRLTAGISPGYGYTGIVVAMLGGLAMPGVLLAGLLLGDLSVGATSAVRSLQIPSQLGAVVQGTLLLVVIGAVALYRARASRDKEPPPDDGEPPPDEPAGLPPAEGPP
ncbi:MAG: ABC transporter permease [Chloroflexota bacterium]